MSAKSENQRLRADTSVRGEVSGVAMVSAMPGRAETDRTLMRRIGTERDRRAFAEIASHYAPRLKAWLMARGESGPTAEDIVQDVMIKIWRKADMFDAEKASFSTWAFRLTRNRWIDHKRKNDRLTPVEPEILAREIDRDAEAPQDGVAESEMTAAVRAELALLPAEQKQILHLAFFEGLSHSQIAARTGLPLGTVKSRIRLPLKKLQDRLRQFEGGWR